MKTLHYFLLIGLGLMNSCSKKHDNTDILLTHKDVIIGCKPGQPITLGVDPIKSNEFNFNDNLCNSSVTGPSCLNNKKDCYYAAGDDKMIDEIEIGSGKVKRSFQTSSYPVFIHYRATDNSLIYAQPVDTKGEFALFKVDLNSGSTSSLPHFTTKYGIGIRTSFMRNNGVYFLNGMGEITRVDLSTFTVSMVTKLKQVTNSLGYDNKLDKLFYLASPNAKDFSMFCYEFSNDTHTMLKHYPDIITHMVGSTVYNPGNNNYYFYIPGEQRVTINVISLDKKIDKVKYPLINTEIVDCTVRQDDIHMEN
jgi:hypothetical protein